MLTKWWKLFVRYYIYCSNYKNHQFFFFINVQPTHFSSFRSVLFFFWLFCYIVFNVVFFTASPIICWRFPLHLPHYLSYYLFTKLSLLRPTNAIACIPLLALYYSYHSFPKPSFRLKAVVGNILQHTYINFYLCPFKLTYYIQ